MIGGQFYTAIIGQFYAALDKLPALPHSFPQKRPLYRHLQPYDLLEF